MSNESDGRGVSEHREQLHKKQFKFSSWCELEASVGHPRGNSQGEAEYLDLEVSERTSLH